MAPLPSSDKKVETKTEAEALIPKFALDRVLNQDQSGRRITLIGTIDAEPALLTLERAAFPADSKIVSEFLQSLANTTNLGANDVYRWYMSNHSPSSLSTATTTPVPDLKINLIYPCTPTHIRKYTAQQLRYVTETADIYRSHIRPYIERTHRTPARLDWIYNILDGITEQDDVVFRSPSFGASSSGAESDKKGFILLPDLNWDRKTVTGLHLLALVERRDVWSLRDLKKRDVDWLNDVRKNAVTQAARYGSGLARTADDEGEPALDEDMLKCYVHYQPTYYHFHIHVVHVMLEAEGTTQSVGKAILLDSLISQLEHMSPDSGEETGLDTVDVSYFVGEENDIWKKCFAKVKKGDRIDINC